MAGANQAAADAGKWIKWSVIVGVLVAVHLASSSGS